MRSSTEECVASSAHIHFESENNKMPTRACDVSANTPSFRSQAQLVNAEPKLYDTPVMDVGFEGK